MKKMNEPSSNQFQNCLSSCHAFQNRNNFSVGITSTWMLFSSGYIFFTSSARLHCVTCINLWML